MATFEITSPDGAKYQVTAPEDATHDQIMSYVQTQGKSSAFTDEYSPLQAGLIGAGKMMTRLGQGVRQMLPGDNSKLDAQVAEENRLYAPLQQQHPIATTIGEAAPYLALPIGGAAGVGSQMLRAAATSAIPGAVEYGTPEERAKRAGLGAAGGAVGALGGYGLGRVLNPVRLADPAATLETQSLARGAGVDLTAAQATGSKALAGLEGTLAQLPGSAGKMATIQQTQREAFNRKAMGMLGETTSNISNDATQIAKNNIGDRFTQAAKGVAVPVDDALVNDLAQVEAKYSKNLTPDQKPIVGQYLDDILNQSPNISGEAYQAWRSRIGARAASTQDSELKGALKGIQGALDNAFARSAPEAQAQLMQQARGQWRNLKTLEPLIEKAAMTSSNIPPAQVMSRALSTKNTQGEMQGLAQLGQTIGKEYPNSGTVPRLFWQSLLQNPLTLLRPDFLLGATGGPMAAAKIYNSSPVKNYLTKGLLNVDPETERLLLGYSGLLGGGIGSGAGR